ncbi:hypothetical protein [Planomonospora venezuelensis]|uniref:DUF234 domain-containing protein n=1 Tax=Planomonospora venezuelensis TaxID=1999 RepID=A0A841D022_PLAVE|nr:hypothetical protein [Planomonospora venezuelensis]MBB5962869.1 hypothetical protein [Planomonospora venezuelensis]GIM99334.1 hypothetical protein Pve01_09930 [Planomonospora venezuelensis]
MPHPGGPAPWRADGQDQIDAVVIGRRNRTKTPIMVGESKWTREVDAARLCRKLAAKTTELTGSPDDLAYAICARESVTNAAPDILTVTAADIFTPDPL